MIPKLSESKPDGTASSTLHIPDVSGMLTNFTLNVVPQDVPTNHLSVSSLVAPPPEAVATATSGFPGFMEVPSRSLSSSSDIYSQNTASIPSTITTNLSYPSEFELSHNSIHATYPETANIAMLSVYNCDGHQITEMAELNGLVTGILSLRF